MPKYIIPVTYTMYGKYEIEADNISEALDKVFDPLTGDLPEEPVILDDSLNVIEEDVVENNNLTDDDVDELSTYLEERYRSLED
jgi:hypothetical protein